MNNNNQLLKSYIQISIFAVLCLTSIVLPGIAGLTILFSLLYIFVENKKTKGKGQILVFFHKIFYLI